MKVRCVKNTGEALRAYENKSLSKDELERFWATGHTEFGLTIGDEFSVMGIGSNYISTVLTTAENTFIDNYNNAPQLPEYLSNFVGTLAESHSFV